jgi:hypothetical protein
VAAVAAATAAGQLALAGKFLVEYALYNYRPVPEGEACMKFDQL